MLLLFQIPHTQYIHMLLLLLAVMYIKLVYHTIYVRRGTTSAVYYMCKSRAFKEEPVNKFELPRIEKNKVYGRDLLSIEFRRLLPLLSQLVASIGTSPAQFIIKIHIITKYISLISSNIIVIQVVVVNENQAKLWTPLNLLHICWHNYGQN